MSTFGWVLMAGAFLLLIMVANNSWPWVWSSITGGPAPGASSAPSSSSVPPPSVFPPQLSPQPFQIPNPQDPEHPLTVMG